MAGQKTSHKLFQKYNTEGASQRTIYEREVKSKCYCIVDKVLWNRSITQYKIKQHNRWSKITKWTKVILMVPRNCKQLSCENTVFDSFRQENQSPCCFSRLPEKEKRKKKSPNYPIRQVKMSPWLTQETQLICWQQDVHKSSWTKNTEGKEDYLTFCQILINHLQAL